MKTSLKHRVSVSCMHALIADCFQLIPALMTSVLLRIVSSEGLVKERGQMLDHILLLLKAISPAHLHHLSHAHLPISSHDGERIVKTPHYEMFRCYSTWNVFISVVMECVYFSCWYMVVDSENYPMSTNMT